MMMKDFIPWFVSFIPWFVSSQTKRVNNENHSPLYLLQNDDERFQSRVKNPRQPLWLFKTWASGG